MSTTNPTSSLNSSTIAPVVVGTDSNIEKTFPATDAQIEVWLGSLQGVDASCSFNEIATIGFTGELDVANLQAAIAKTVRRNDALRSVYSSDGTTVRVLKELALSLRIEDWSHENDLNFANRQNELIIEQGNTPFDLQHGPLIRLILQKSSDQRYFLTINAHHILLDGWSLAVLVRDLGYFYDVENGVTREPLPPAVSYQSFSTAMTQYHHSDQRVADETYWVETFSDAIPVLDLPIVDRRPPVKTFAAARHDHVLGVDLVDRLKKQGARSGCSLFNTMLAAFQSYLCRISAADDFSVGIPTSGQATMDFPDLLGMCVNTIPLRSSVDTNLSFEDYMKRSRNELLDAMEHQRLSFASLLRIVAPPRDPSRSPIVSVSFNLDPELDMDEMGFQGVDLKVIVEPRAYENFEWFVNGVIQNDRSVELQVQYNTDLFDSTRMEELFDGFERFLNEVVENPQSKIRDFNVISVSQQKKLAVDFNATAMDYPDGSTLHQEFSLQAAQSPDSPCVVFEDTTLNFAQVDQRSNQIAAYLIQQGMGQGDLVGICVPRSAEMLVQLFGILKTGAGYVPLDPDYPIDRLQYMCEHSGLKSIVTDSTLAHTVAELGKPTVEIDSLSAEIDAQSNHVPPQTSGPADVCYVIYTSGSTGKPKGVRVPHGSVLNFLHSMQQKPGLGPGDSVLAVTTLSFDIAVLELFLPALFGGKIVIADRRITSDGIEMAKAIDHHDISILQATPATWRLLLAANWDGKQDLKILCGGEPMPSDLVDPLLQRCDELWNMYGPTETTVWSTVFKITSAQQPILIGRPIGNTQIYVLDGNGNPVPVGSEGEIYIGGAGVTLGYLNKPQHTAQRFVDHRWFNPFSKYVSDKIYKTGDIGRYRSDGNLEFLRRNDKQVKVRGFRIELGEIETVLQSHPAVDQAVVIVREDVVGDVRLVAYWVGADLVGADLVGDDLVGDDRARDAQGPTVGDHLRLSLPYYMVPQHLVAIDAMPQTENGKIDYKSLPVPQQNTPQTTTSSAPTTAGETLLIDVWQNVLETEDIGVHDNFFDLGGHSLLVMQAITEVESRTGVKLSPRDFLIGTVSQMAERLQDAYPNSTAAADGFAENEIDQNEIDQNQIDQRDSDQRESGQTAEIKTNESAVDGDSTAAVNHSTGDSSSSTLADGKTASSPSSKPKSKRLWQFWD